MVEIREVTNKRELRKFVDYPNKLYKDNPYLFRLHTRMIWRIGTETGIPRLNIATRSASWHIATVRLLAGLAL